MSILARLLRRRSSRGFASLYAAVALVMLAAVSFAPLAARAQSTPAADLSQGTITVNGTGVITVDPDMATISFGVENQSRLLEDAQTSNSTAITKVTKALTDGGVDAKDIQTSSYYVYPISKYDDSGNYVGVTGYQVSTTLSVKVKDLDKLGTLLDSAVAAGANFVYGISFSVEDPSKPADQARAAAVADARGKADTLAKAAGLVITGVYSINETSSPTPMAQDYQAAASAADSAPMAKQVPISAGTTQVEVDIQIVFETTPANG
ncbi:MAG TPA: SIMPL domain-containing protein [Thermomicrobiales bacterium]|nr:SIMPL domain-containing protein [Thermomicrobiales bacterium]